MKLNKNTVVVMEGLDGTGKSTQAELTAATLGAELIHMPSGWGAFSDQLYDIMENNRDMRALTRQLIHLACHEENIHRIYEQLQSTAVVMDRWWWSTVAYGYYGAELDARIPQHMFMNTLGMVWSGFRADLVFLFEHNYKEDAWNNERIAKAYDSFAEQTPETTIRVPDGEPDYVHRCILDQIEEAGLCS